MTFIAPTERQLAVLSFVVRHMAEHDGRAPTLREIAAELGISLGAVVDRVAALRQKKLIAANKDALFSTKGNTVPTHAGRTHVRQIEEARVQTNRGDRCDIA